MKRLTGKSVSAGAAFGVLRFYRRTGRQIPRYQVQERSQELERFAAAQRQAMEQLGELAERARAEAGEESAILFETHQMMLEDDDFCDAIRQRMEEGANVEAAVADATEQFAQMLAQMDDAYMQARAADVRDIGGRMLDILCGCQPGQVLCGDEPCIVGADDLSPSETIQLDKSRVKAFVMSAGTANSHTAILARTLGIPAVMNVGQELYELEDGSELFVDGSTGEVVSQPDVQTRQQIEEQLLRQQEHQKLLETLKGLPSETKDGRIMQVFANIGSEADLDAVLANDAEGIGLFRSEFLYLQGQDYPDEETQFQSYRTVAERMQGRRVIIRTMDIGSDKTADYFHLGEEANPALGYRAIRICLDRPEVFLTQLRALYRASLYGNLAVMFPMIASEWEVQAAKALCRQACRELEQEGVPFRADVKLGIMLETPAAVIMARQLAKQVDFFSIGTNDLTQYTLAIDRQCGTNLDRFYDAHHPAVLRLIRYAADAAHEAGIPIGICGELGADLSLAETFLAFGIDEVSVSPASVLPMRQKIRSLDGSRRQAILDEMLP